MPENLDIPRDELVCRLDCYHDAIILYLCEKDKVTSRVVSARDLTLALLRTVPLDSGLLPDGALWWAQSREGVQVALWRSPRVWPVALMQEAFKPPRRFKLPMPGLIFVCTPGRTPRVYAAKRRPKSLADTIYHAPLFNVFSDGRTCQGTHKFPDELASIPESFFMSFFTCEAHPYNRSKKHPRDLLKLWVELDGKSRYPVKDLVSLGKVQDIMK